MHPHSDSSQSHYAIVADIGGTFARFSRVNLDTLQLDMIQIYPCAEFISLEFVLLTYQTQYRLHNINRVAIAIACPVLDDFVAMTNCHWNFSIRELQNKLGLSELKIMNDFTAIATAIPELKTDQLIQIGKGLSDPRKTRVVLGAGTGLGVAYLVPQNTGYVAFSGEGGHADWGAQTDDEWLIYNYLKKKYDHVSYERLISGQGLEHLYQAIAALNQQATESLKAAQIINLALTDQCTIAQQTIKHFFAILGAYAGDLALIFGAFGGIYIAGGIVPRLVSLLERSDFRTRFEDKGRFKSFNTLIPTYIITAEQPGILGAAVYLKQSAFGEMNAIS